MFDLSFGEVLVIGTAVVLFVKPEDIPDIMRSIGKGLGKLRNLSNEFAAALEEGSGVKEIKQQIKGLDGTLYDVYDVPDNEQFYEAQAPENTVKKPVKKSTARKSFTRKPAAKSKAKKADVTKRSRKK